MLLDRKTFREGVFARDHNECVVCGVPAVDAHHIIERRLWSDGGYYLENGVSLCGLCHLEAEKTYLSPRFLREKAGITGTILPPGWDDEIEYDKWGNPTWPDLTRSKGPLFNDESVQKILKEAGVLHLFRPYYKHPRTPHLPWSPNAGRDEDSVKDVFGELSELYIATPDVVVTQKLDGEQISMYGDHYHARSIDSGYHPSRTWVGNLHGKIAHEIPEGWRLVGENVYAAHSIQYHDLPSYFFLFAIFNHVNECIPWTDTKLYAEMLGLETVPEVYRGEYDRKQLEEGDFWKSPWGEVEGYVVRSPSQFSYFVWDMHVGKVVRKDHVKTSQHWRHKPLVPNRLTSA